jgi:prepilin-type N-terminal cleavage/methylation domain-containing protein
MLCADPFNWVTKWSNRQGWSRMKGRNTLSALRRRPTHRRLVGFNRDAAPSSAGGTIRDEREAGFTLVEVLVAFAILSIVLLTLFSGLSTALFGDRRAEFTRIALRLAKAELETAGVGNPLTPGETIGRFENGMEWRLSVQPYAFASPNAPPGYWVKIIVRPPSGSSRSSFASALAGHIALTPSVTLTTLKLVTSLQ